MPLELLLLQYWWFAAAVMVLTTLSDYALTLWGARLLRGASAHIGIEGSYEGMPIFEKDVDAGRRVSPRFISMLFVWAGILALAARYRQQLGMSDEAYLFIAGLAILVQVPVHVRHVSNIIRFSLLAHGDAAQGHVTYARWFLLRMSGGDFIAFGVLFFLAFAATASWFVFGGAVRCCLFGLFQLFQSRRAMQKRIAVVA